MNALALTAPVSAPVKDWTDGLTAKMVAFVETYVRCRNATLAYDDAYEARGGKYETRRDNGSALLNKPEIQAAIKARQAIATQESGVDVAWLLTRFMQIATADPRELIGLKVGCCRYCHGEGFGYQWREREYLEAVDKAERDAQEAAKRGAALDVAYPDPAGGFGFNATFPPRDDCPQCHGEGLERFVPRDTDRLSEQAALLYGGVKVKKDGYEIIIADRSKALELAGRILGAFNDKVRVSGAIAHAHAIADLRSVDPIEAGKLYRQFIGQHLTG